MQLLIKLSMCSPLKKKTINVHIFLLSLLIFIVFISLMWADMQSLIAHDEGLYARRAKLISDSGDWLSPFASPHHKTVGSYWAIAISLKIFGISDWASRLPSIVAGYIATLLFYFTSLRYFKPLNSLVASLALIAMPIYFQSLRTAGPDMILIALIMAQVYFLTSAKNASRSVFRWKILGFGACVAMSFFVRSLVALIPLVSLFPLILALQYVRSIQFWIWAVSGLFLGSIPLIFNLLSVFEDHGYSGLVSLVSFASRKADVTEWNLFSSLPFYFTRLVLLTFPAFVFLLPRMQSFGKRLFSDKACGLRIELNALTILFPLIYIILLSFIGARHYHYLLPLVPLLALNIARMDLIFKRSAFRLETSFAGVMFVLYMLGACALCFKRDYLLDAAFYTGFFAIIFSSILCFYAFYSRFFSRRKLSPFASIFAFLMAQYLTISALSASGIIWSTNKDLKALAISINSECKSGVYLYGLPSKDETILTFYLDNSYVLRSLGGLSAEYDGCLVAVESSKSQVLQDLSSHKISNFYFR